MDGMRHFLRRMGTPGLAPGVLAALLLAAPAPALTLSNVSNVTLRATKTSNLTVGMGSGSTVNFTLVQGGIANGSSATAITTSWNVNPGQTGTVRLYAYFTNASAALAGPTQTIASTYVEGRMTTGAPTTYTPITQTNPVGPAGGSLLLFSESITGVNKNKTRTDNLDLRINLTSSPPLAADTYTGTLRIQARAL